MHVPLEHVPPVMQRLPPLQDVPSATLVIPVHCPDELHVPVPDTQSLALPSPQLPLVRGVDAHVEVPLHDSVVHEVGSLVQVSVVPTHAPAAVQVSS